MKEHTPGPWSVRARDGSRSRLCVETGAGCNIADIIGGDDPEIAANAALIAAAPAMREALEEIADLCRGPAITRNELAHAIEESARSALALAGGGK